LRFHLDRKTGGLSRVIERGTKGIDTLLSIAIFNTFPTVLELAITSTVFLFVFNIWFTVATVIMVVLYVWFTFAITRWRIQFRRDMNQSDQDANTKAVDSLLNYETVNISTTKVTKRDASTNPWSAMPKLRFRHRRR